MKKFIASLLTICLCLNIFFTDVHASDSISKQSVLDASVLKTVYIDGIKYTITLSNDLDIVVTGGDKKQQLRAVLHKDGIADATIKKSNGSTEKLTLDIETLNQKEINVDVYKNKKYVKSIKNIDEIVSDSYDGQIAIPLSFVLEILYSALEVLIVAGLILVIAGLVYIEANKFYDVIKAKIRDKSVTKKEKKKYKESYFPAFLKNGNVFIGLKGKTLKKAAAAYKSGKNFYTIFSYKARLLITTAGMNPSKKEIDKNRKKGHYYFWHFHRANKKGKAIHKGNNYHSWFGRPILGTK